LCLFELKVFFGNPLLAVWLQNSAATRPSG